MEVYITRGRGALLKNRSLGFEIPFSWMYI